MVTAVRRSRGKVDSTADNTERVAAVIAIDGMFRAYEIELTPLEALAFGRRAPGAGVQKVNTLFTLVNRINEAVPPANFGPEHPQTGRPHHYFRIGRERDKRLLKVEIFKGYFQVGYDFLALVELIHGMGKAAGAQVKIHAGTNSYTVEMHWPGDVR